jgi:hypothetical protein
VSFRLLPLRALKTGVRGKIKRNLIGSVSAVVMMLAQGSPPVNVLGLLEAQEFARPYIEAGMKVEISDAATGKVIKRHPARAA